MAHSGYAATRDEKAVEGVRQF